MRFVLRTSVCCCWMAAGLICINPPNIKVGGQIIPGTVAKKRSGVCASQTPRVKVFSAFCITLFSLESTELASRWFLRETQNTSESDPSATVCCPFIIILLFWTAESLWVLPVLSVCLYWDKISLCSSGCSRTHHVDRAGLEFTKIYPTLPGIKGMWHHAWLLVGDISSTWLQLWLALEVDV